MLIKAEIAILELNLRLLELVGYLDLRRCHYWYPLLELLSPERLFVKSTWVENVSIGRDDYIPALEPVFSLLLIEAVILSRATVELD